jgi:hypothetical protein
MVHPGYPQLVHLERFPAKWTPVRVKKTRQIKNLELRSDSIGTVKALDLGRDSATETFLKGTFSMPGDCARLRDPSARPWPGGQRAGSIATTGKSRALSSLARRYYWQFARLSI